MQKITTNQKSAAPKKKPGRKITIKPDVAVVPLTKKTKVKLPYHYAVGRRKSSVARVRIHKKGDAAVIINEKPYQIYFLNYYLQSIIEAPLKLVDLHNKLYITIKVQGGGPRGQAESARHGISRALLLVNPEYRGDLKKAGFLKRDPRVKERKKYGLKRARRAPQWSKR